jgi:transposase
MVVVLYIEETITIPLKEYQAMQAQIVELTKQVKELLEAVALLKNGRNSKTSSTPSSQDYQRGTIKSLRASSGRLSGGQKGHEGKTLEMRATPDSIVDYRPLVCKGCAMGLAFATNTLQQRRQEIVLPPIVPQYVEHRSFSCICNKCGFNNQAALPKRLKGNVQYSPQISSLVGYLSVRQYLSYNRIAEMMKDVFSLHISEGTVYNMLTKLAVNAWPTYEAIQQKIGKAEVVGGDETGVKINGKKGWLFTFQNELLTFLSVSFSRGFDSILNLFKDGFPQSVYVSDCLAAQLKTPAKLHQICLVHLLRDLNNFIDVYNCQWSTSLKMLFKEAIVLKKELTQADYKNNNPKVEALQKRLTNLLAINADGKSKKIKAFIKRLRKNNNAIFTFLYHQKVPPDNNGSENSIRNAKVKMKVSCQFKTLDGANTFALLRSIIDTAIKNKQNPLQAFNSCV